MLNWTGFEDGDRQIFSDSSACSGLLPTALLLRSPTSFPLSFSGEHADGVGTHTAGTPGIRVSGRQRGVLCRPVHRQQKADVSLAFVHDTEQAPEKRSTRGSGQLTLGRWGMFQEWSQRQPHTGGASHGASNPARLPFRLLILSVSQRDALGRTADPATPGRAFSTKMISFLSGHNLLGRESNSL